MLQRPGGLGLSEGEEIALAWVTQCALSLTSPIPAMSLAHEGHSTEADTCFNAKLPSLPCSNQPFSLHCPETSCDWPQHMGVRDLLLLGMNIFMQGGGGGSGAPSSLPCD